jgi:hypothetical protein
MDETANGVREQLVQWFARDVAHTGKSPSEVADAILARFEVTAKPVVTDEDLGQLIMTASGFLTNRRAGERLRTYLAEAGLAIVRSGEAM